MTASLLTVFQTEPWSLMFLGATLFALSSFAKRRSTVAAGPASADVPAVFDGTVAVPALVQPVIDDAAGAPRAGARSKLGIGVAEAA
jgi:hypothetical protein